MKRLTRELYPIMCDQTPTNLLSVNKLYRFGDKNIFSVDIVLCNHYYPSGKFGFYTRNKFIGNFIEDMWFNFLDDDSPIKHCATSRADTEWLFRKSKEELVNEYFDLSNRECKSPSWLSEGIARIGSDDLFQFLRHYNLNTGESSFKDWLVLVIPFLDEARIVAGKRGDEPGDIISEVLDRTYVHDIMLQARTFLKSYSDYTIHSQF